MKFNYINDTDFKLFLTNNYFDEVNYESKEELMILLKSIILKLKKNYSVVVSGLYEVDIYILRNIGIEFLFTKSENYSFTNKVIDLKMTIHLNPNIYLKFNNYDYISNYKEIRYHEGSFYLKADNLEQSDFIILSDFYNIIIDEEEAIDNYLLLEKN